MCSDETAIDWDHIDTLLLDMDGTVLDLAFDNYFWLDLLPQHVARVRGISLSAAKAQMQTHTTRVYGSLQWYCIDHWSELLSLDVAAIKHATRHRIAYLPGALGFLRHARTLPRRLVIVTNAHPQTLAIKVRQTHLDRHVDAIFSSHDIGHPKESAEFWSCFERAEGLQRERAVLIDDSVSVVTAAREHGLGGVVTITRPDSGRPQRQASAGPAVESLAELASVLGNR